MILVAITAIVPTHNSTVCEPLSVPPRSVVITETHVHLGWKVIPSAHMGALPCRIIKQQDFQKVSRLAAAPRRPSTNLM